MFKLSVVAQSCPTLCDPMDCSPPDSSVHGIFQARILEWVAISFSRDLPDPGIELGSSASQADALPSEPPGKPQEKYFFEPLFLGGGGQEYWSGLPFPSPGIFPTQGLNLGLPHCRQILYHLSHQGSWSPFTHSQVFSGGSDGKEFVCNAGDLGSISGSGRSPAEGNNNPFQYSCLENLMDKGAWWAAVH